MINGLYQPVSYAGDGAQTVFPITFEFVSSGDIRALARVNGLDTTLTPGVDFTVSGTALTTVTAPAVGATLIIYMEMPFTQKADYRNTGKLNLEVLESSLDKAALASQELRDQMGRAVKVPIGSTIDPFDLISQLEVDAAAASSAASTAATQAQAAATQAQAAAQSATDAAASAAAAQTAAGGVRASATDTTPAPLADKLQAGEGLVLTLQNPGANECLVAAVDRRIISTARILNHAMNGGF